ncbi:SDR family NAD(P)-dependent oxidoreductase [Aliikangiella coralliicola]|uniref:SDR family NAD(P)-dependent oxidoreductase n=1 Tax=Aliikangiella coralliicola TaxID=2592383 RepID=A0A545U953_9GAMM|nr:SDR family NAD(P)-dependent oxidoreductase [Aliikangiella coralliicola]TQV86002.1 SDR family NAD(P)-dependent oxidoreductase [Aliikangiella coralliicola]
MEQTNQLKTIYRDLSQGKLTQQQALEKIKAIKLKQKNASGVLLATPVWEEDASVVSNSPLPTVEHCVLLCHLPTLNAPQLKSDLSASQVVSIVQRNKDIAADYSELALNCFEQIQSMLKSRPQGPVLFQVVAADNEQMTMLSGLSGLLKTAMLENPQLIAQIVFTDVIDSPEGADQLVQQLNDARNYPQETLIRYQQNERKFLHWQEIKATAFKETAFKEQGTYLITGGLGGLGVLLTQEILQQTRHGKIIVTGRSPLTAEKQSILENFSTLNTQSESRVEYRQLDIENERQVESLIASINTPEASLKGIIHCAGMTSDNFIIKKSSEEFRQVLAPKVLGTYHLDQASRDLALDFFVLFSSAASWLGNVGQSDYAAANGFMDQFSAYRHQLVTQGERQGKSLSVNWSLWREGGMEIEPSMLSQIEQNTGAVQLETASGLGAFYRSLQLPYSQFSVTEGNIQKLRVALLENTSLQQASSKDEIATANVTTQSDNEVVSHAPSKAKHSQQNLQESTEGYLCKQFSKLLKLPSHKIDAQAPLEKYGIDSIMAMNLTSQLEKTFGSLPKTLFFEYQTIAELAQYFVRSHSAKIESLFAVKTDNTNSEENIGLNRNQLAAESKEARSQSIKIKSALKRRKSRQRVVSTELSTNESGHQDRTKSESTKFEHIAIVGLSGRYPEAANLNDYWKNLSSGKDCIISIPKERWDWQKFYSEDRSVDGSHASKWGGFIEGVDEFDPRFFNISPREAETIDPQERLFLQHAWMAVEDAGFTRKTLQIPHENAQAGQVGVYVGVMYGEYNLSGSLASIANRVSYVLNLHGPSMTLDTMCSSSLTAIHLACQDLKHGRTDLGIAGGVNVTIHPNKYEMLSAEQFISSDGHCQSFGEGGDGYIPGEGVGAVILKRLSEAVRDGHHIYGVIKGSALNHGGKTNGYTVPNPQAQSSAITQALIEAEVEPRQVSYIEAHGTGTKLGDPIEIAALTRAFNQQDSNTVSDESFGYCLIGSAKSNVGHCESAAGVAGLTKVLLQMKHQQIVPSLHSSTLNPHIDFDNTPFVVNQKLTEWKTPVIDGVDVPRIAGVSSFGAGGSNAHIIIEEFRGARNQEKVSFANQSERSIIPLSARTAEQLTQKALDLLNYVVEQQQKNTGNNVGDSLELSAIAYTLQVGREAMDQRVGFIVNSVEQLVDKLNAFVKDNLDIEDVFHGQVKNNRETVSLLNADKEFQETIDKWVSRKKLSKLVDLWVKGFELDWNSFYPEVADSINSSGKMLPRLISLPAYPFAREKYWIDPVAVMSKLPLSAQTAGVAIHPLLHNNHSDLHQQSYSSVFSGQEFFFDRLSQSSESKKILPAEVNSQTLPVAIYLEMARAAAEHAMPVLRESVTLELQDFVLGQPAEVSGERAIKIDLFSADDSDGFGEQIEFEIYSERTELESSPTDKPLSQLDDEIIHCQGKAVFTTSPAPQKHDLEKIKQSLQLDEKLSLPLSSSVYVGTGEMLANLDLSAETEGELGDFILHPGIVNSVVYLATGLVNREDENYVPVALRTTRVIFGCTQQMVAWVRHANNNASAQESEGYKILDVDLCDAAGNVCLQLHGITFESEALSLTPPSLTDSSTPSLRTEGALTNAAIEKATLVPEKIALSSSFRRQKRISHLSFNRGTQKKPQDITLAPIDFYTNKESYYESKERPSIGLVDFQNQNLELMGLEATESELADLQREKVNTHRSTQKATVLASPVNLFNLGNGIYSIQVGEGKDENGSNNLLELTVIELLTEAFEIVKQAEDAKVLLLKGTEKHFLHGGRQHSNEALQHRLYQNIISFPYPVVAVLQGNASGAGFLAAALCDFMIVSEEASYQYCGTQAGLYPSKNEADLLAKRFGESITSELLDSIDGLNGRELRLLGLTCPVLPKDEINPYAQKLTSTLAEKSQPALKLLKQHLARHLSVLADNLEIVEPSNDIESVKQKNNNTTEPNSRTEMIQLRTEADSILVISLKHDDISLDIRALIDELEEIFGQLKQSAIYKAVVIESEYPEFLPAVESNEFNAVVTAFSQLILASDIPVVAALNSNVQGVAWLMSLFCNTCIYHAQGCYTIDSIKERAEWLNHAAAIVTCRLGNQLGTEILFAGGEYSGVDLQQKLPSVKIAQPNQVAVEALQVARNWSLQPRPVLIERKKRDSLRIQQVLADLHDTLQIKEEKGKEPIALPDSPMPLSLNSKVISAQVYPQGILQVTMEDRQAKNMFSDELAEGMIEVFSHIEATPSYKVVVLTGYDNYFAMGGTKETLVAIQEGKVKFTDSKIYQLALKCSLPVVAAMQGHGVGAGWALGMFADFTIFSEESQYMSPYMNYGFTPGAGSTLIFPEKIGYDLARETLLTALETSGTLLLDRGVSFSVLPRKNVLSAAMSLAERIARHSRAELVALKSLLTVSLQSQLDEIYQLELSMHEKTFVGQSETLAQIQDKFSAGSNTNAENEKVADLQHSPIDEQTYAVAINEVELMTSLKKLLAEELRLQTDEIEEDEQFVDLGLDSITGVTWIRKVNEKYGTAIEATKVYSYPTLKQLSRYVKQEVEAIAETSNAVDVEVINNKLAENVDKVTVSTKNVSAKNVKAVKSEAEKLLQSEKTLQSEKLPKPEINKSNLLTSINETLKKLLAQELRLQVEEIDEDAQFVELGLDSITGVTWVRKINDKYKTSIEATKVYSYPTLKQLSDYVQAQASEAGILIDDSPRETPPVLNEVSQSQPVQRTSQTNDSNKSSNIATELNTTNSLRPIAAAVKNLVSRRRKKLTKSQNKQRLSVKSQHIAIIGMAGQFPKAKDLDSFWDNIAQSKNCIDKIPANRWDINAYYQPGDAMPGKTNSQWMGALEEFDLFDPLFFNISPKEAKSMDPQQRVFLQTCWRGIENAGYSAQSLSGTKCGVFVGCAAGDYHLLSRQQQISAQGFTGEATSILAARVSYFLNLQGPCLSIDTACSSSLVAIANACDSLSAGGSDLALAGGVYVMSGPEMLIKTSQTGMLSPDGRCFTFDQRANGFVPGEGVGVVMLKRLKDAEKDQDIIQGVIKGWGVNQDGKTNGITAPNPEAQRQLLQDVYEKHQIDPASIQLIEAHGTGTKLGDPIEIDGLKESFKKFTRKTDYCAIGSVKSNIGHCLTAAGVSGVIKIALALKHKQLPPTTNFEQLNEHIGSQSKGLKGTPFFVNTRLKAWDVDEKEQRQAAISSFGFSGTNAHMVIGEYIPEVDSKPDVSAITENGKLVIPLSARTSKQLYQKAEQLLAFLLTRSHSIELVDLAYTLQVGRDAMEERLGFMVDSVSQLTEKLEAFVNDSNSDNDSVINIDDAYRGQVERNKEGMRIISQDDEMKETVIEKWLSSQKLSKLLELWVNGLELDWNKLYQSEGSVKTKPNRIPLPTYPFDNKRYWIEPVVDSVSQTGDSQPDNQQSATNKVNAGSEVVNSSLSDVLHSLLHTNTSDLTQQSYTSCFDGNEFFLKTLPDKQKFLPSMLSLEMARAAIDLAVPNYQESEQSEQKRHLVYNLELYNVVWAQPIVVDENNSVSIALFATQPEQVDFEIYSQSNADEIVHCQGHANFVQQGDIPAVNISAIQANMKTAAWKGNQNKVNQLVVQQFQQNENQRLIEVLIPQLPEAVKENKTDFTIHPSLIDVILLSASDLVGSEAQTCLPFALKSIRFVSACSEKVFVWSRFSKVKSAQDSQLKLDIDICDTAGQVCMQVRGLSYQQVVSKEQPKVVQATESSKTSAAPKQISLPTPLVKINKAAPTKVKLAGLQNLDCEKVPASQVEQTSPAKINKPNSIALSNIDGASSIDGANSDVLCFSESSNIDVPGETNVSEKNISSEPQVRLSNTVFSDIGKADDSGSEELNNASVSLFDYGNGIYSIQIINDVDNNQLTENLVQQLLQAIGTAKLSSTIKVLLINGSETCFLHGQRDDYNYAVAEGLYQEVISFPVPVVAVMQGDAVGAGFMLGALCDFMICSESGNYNFVDVASGFYPSVNDENLFSERFGQIATNDFLHGQTKLTGKALRAKGWTCAVIVSSEIETYAQKFATSLTTKSQNALRLLKQHLSRHLISLVNELKVLDIDQTNDAGLSSENSQKKNSKIKINSNLIELEEHAKNVLVINLKATKKKLPKKKQKSDLLISDLSHVFNQVSRSKRYKSLVLSSEHDNFLPPLTEKSNLEVLEALEQLIVDSPLPVVAALKGDSNGSGWMVSQICDACVYSQEGRYSVKALWQSPGLLRRVASLFEYRLGRFLGKEIILTATDYSGKDLQQRCASLNLVDHHLVLPTAVELAQQWNEQPLSKLLAWKKQGSALLKNKLIDIPEWSVEKELESSTKNGSVNKIDSDAKNQKEKKVTLNSKVISASIYPDGVLLVRMEDREARNMFSDAFIEGMFEVFEHIENTPEYKVVVLTGYDSYFSSGGTKEGLLAIQDGQYKFTDRKVFQLAMTCRLPVIAAMQGHGIGAGWAMGMYADLTLMSEESHFVSPYMNYGFTPGAGSTAIFPNKIGYDLARDTMLTAQEYSGRELKKKGLSVSILPRKNVVAEAMVLAQQIAQRPSSQLISLKQQWNQPLHDLLEDTFQLELAMHEKTFVGQSETFEQIQTSFAKGTSSVVVDSKQVESPASDIHLEPQDDKADNSATESLSSINATLKKLLAQELQMSEEDIGKSTPFTNLGVDSIIGVSWVRKINEQYNISIEGTKIYSYPTLSELSEYVKEEVDQLRGNSQENRVVESSETVPAEEVIPERNSLERNSLERKNASDQVTTSGISSTQINQVDLSSVTEMSQKADTLPDIVATLKKLLAQELQMSEQDIGKDTPFINLGVDSIIGVSWVRKINEEYQISIEGTKIYSYPTLTELGEYVHEVAEREGNLVKSEASNQANNIDIIATNSSDGIHCSESVSGNTQTSVKNSVMLPAKQLASWRNSSAVRINNSRVSSESAVSQTQPIAVIGMAGQFPQANNLEEFWKNIASGKNCISEVPAERWDIDSYYQPGDIVPGKTNCKWMGALEGYDLFDPLFFNISPLEAENMDPQQRLFLQTSWQTIEDAGYNAEALSGSKCGVFVGCGTGDYHQFAQGMGGSVSILAARISYFLNLQGPCLSIDTACSSSLVAIANACDSLVSKGSDIALAGGVCVLAGPSMHIGTSQSGMLSTEGRCFTFDQKANGFVPGEGVGVVMLKRLSDAERDEDIIQGVIQGWGVNQDGKTNGITAPNPKSQTRLQQEVYDKFAIDPEHIQLVEAHGTGTQLGDPIEVEGLRDSFKKYTQNTDYCALGSVKSNIGHCLFAAGISGFIKVILSLKHQQLPPTINFEQLNGHIGKGDNSKGDRGLKGLHLKDSPFYINDRLQPWELNHSPKRQAAISSFGFSGTNAHLVIAEYQSPVAQPAHQAASVGNTGELNTNVMILLSAKSREQLKQKSVDLLAFIQQKQHVSNPTQRKIILEEIAYTLQVGRQSMEERLGFIVSSIEQLADRLQAFIVGEKTLGEKSGGEQNINDCYQGTVNRNEEGINIISQDDDMKDVVDKWIAHKKYSKLLDLWVKGLELDWNKFYADLRRGESKPKRISLPTYPFAKERYWLDDHIVNSQSGYNRDSERPDNEIQGTERQNSHQATNQTNSNSRSSHEAKINKNFESIEDIINRIANDSIETKQGVTLLKKIV